MAFFFDISGVFTVALNLKNPYIPFSYGTLLITKLTAMDKVSAKYLKKIDHENRLSKYLWGLFISTTLLFVIGKVVGYFDFLSWWCAVPFISTMLVALINYLDWVPSNKNLLYSVGMIYSKLRFAIISLIMWMPIIIPLLVGCCNAKKYGLNLSSILIALAVTIIAYLFIVKLSGTPPKLQAE